MISHTPTATMAMTMTGRREWMREKNLTTARAIHRFRILSLTKINNVAQFLTIFTYIQLNANGLIYIYQHSHYELAKAIKNTKATFLCSEFTNLYVSDCQETSL